jgi:hypothetical protein
MGDVQMHLSTEDTDTIIPLTAEGTTIFLQGRTPTDKELQQCRHITLTSKSPWNPHDVLFPRTETSRGGGYVVEPDSEHCNESMLNGWMMILQQD